MRRGRALLLDRSARPRALGRGLAIALGLSLGTAAWSGSAQAETGSALATAEASSEAQLETTATSDAAFDVSRGNALDTPSDADFDAVLGAQADDDAELGPGVADPRKRRLPRRHRFRLGFQMDYVRLSAAVNEEGMVQRFHYLPLQLDFAYQVQIFKVFMLRPSLAIGGNPANTAEGMPAVVHPQIFAGYSGKAIGVALGYGYLHPFPAVPNVISDTRGGLGQPIITANHAIRLELAYTTRVDRGALAFAIRLGPVKSHIQHYELDERGWRFMAGLNIGWYFGDGHRSEERQRERQQQRSQRRRR